MLTSVLLDGLLLFQRSLFMKNRTKSIASPKEIGSTKKAARIARIHRVILDLCFQPKSNDADINPRPKQATNAIPII
jgi:hypothetical protein